MAAPSLSPPLSVMVARWTAALTAVEVVATFAVGTAAAHAANPAGSHDPVGKINSVQPAKHGVAFVGWAFDPDAPTRNVTVLGVVDGRVVAQGTTDLARPKVTKQHHTGATPGFTFSVQVPTGQHTACLAVRDIGVGVNQVLDCVATPLGSQLDPSQVALHSPSGQLSSATATSSTITVTGFAKEPDMLRRRVTVMLYVDGVRATTAITGRATDAQVAAGSARFGAFRVTVPVSPGSHLGCPKLVNVGLGWNTSLGCRAVDTRGPAGTGRVREPAANKTAVATALRQIGKPYQWGAAGPNAFDCSGLVLWSYHKAGVTTPRIAADQFGAARLIPASRAVRGDLVFYYDSIGHVYHVGIYLSTGRSVAAIDEAEGVNYQTIFGSYVTYGSFTHS